MAYEQTEKRLVLFYFPELKVREIFSILYNELHPFRGQLINDNPTVLIAC